MKSDLKGYTPINVEYVIEEEAKEVFPLSLDFSSLEEEKLNGEKPITNKRDALKFIGKVFTATFPDNELVTRKLDDFEKQNIREEYCTLEENDVPKRKLELEIAIERAKKMKKDAAIVTCDTPKKEREDILSKFKRGDIKVVSNCGTLTTGFDYPELDTIILGRPTKSLALYYQMVGRAIRPSNGKEGWIIDLAGNYRRFGNVADLYIARPPGTTKWDVYSRGRQLTSTIL